MTSPVKPLLVDTSVFSFFFKGDTRAELYRPDVEGKLITVSFATLGELASWALTRGWGSRRIGEMELALKKVVTLRWNEEVIGHWARIQSTRGITVGDNDAWTAACAFAYGCIVVTHDNDFHRIPGLEIISHIA